MKEVREQIAADAAAEAAKAQGHYEDLYKSEQTKVSQLQEQIAELQAQTTEATREQSRKSIGAKYNLPAKVVERLRGETDAEIEADAKELAKELRIDVKAPDSEAGAGNRRDRAGEEDLDRPGVGRRRKAAQRQEDDKTQSKKSYSFIPSGYVPWADRE